MAAIAEFQGWVAISNKYGLITSSFRPDQDTAKFAAELFLRIIAQLDEDKSDVGSFLLVRATLTIQEDAFDSETENN